MPTYDYLCRSCGSVTEVIHSMLEDGPTVCERCGGTLRRVLFPTGIIFKGSGFYRTDSRTAGTGDGSGSGTQKAGSTADATPGAAPGAASTGEGSKKSDAGTSGTTSSKSSDER